MKTSQKFIFSFLIAAIILTFAATAVLADSHDQETKLNITSKLKNVGGQAGFNAAENGEGGSLPEIVGGIIQVFLSVLGILFMAYVIYGGSLWITAHGEEEKITKAKAIIRGSVIGLIIVFAAFAITAFVTINLAEKAGTTF